MKNFQGKLNEIRQAIHLYVAALGLLRILCTLAVGYWIAFLLDYSPLFFGLRESPWLSRLIVIIILSLVIAGFVYRFLFRFFKKRIADDSLRLLIERSNPELNDRLLTMSAKADIDQTMLNSRQKQMLDDLETEISDEVRATRASDLFAFRPLILSGIAALLPIVAIIASLATAPSLTWTAIRRNVFLSNVEYTRRTEIQAVSVRVLPINEKLDEFFPSTKFDVDQSNVIVVGKGSAIELSVELKSVVHSANQSLPESCRLSYQLENGQRGTISLSREQMKGDGRQVFSSRGGILESVESSGDLWISADDAVSRQIKLQIVEPPALAKISQELRFPRYLVDSSAYENGPAEFVNASSYPEGTEVTLKLSFNGNEVEDYRIWNENNGQLLSFENATLDRNNLQFSTTVTAKTELGIGVIDRLGVVSQNQVFLSLDVIEDNLPTVSVTPVGIGQSVTRNAIIPLRIEASDEFGIKNGHLRILANGAFDKILQPFDWSAESPQLVSVDLSALRRNSQLRISDDNQADSMVIQVSTFLNDHNPDHRPASAQDYEFEIVDEKRLVQIIDRQEASLRSRLEEIYQEFSKTRQLCLAIVQDLEDVKKNEGTNLGLAMENGPVFVQRIRLQTQKSAREIIGIANSLDDLVQQLKNNRLTVTLKQVELSSKVEKPLRDFATNGMGRFQSNLLELSDRIRNLKAKDSKDDGFNASRDLVLNTAKTVLDQQAKLLGELNSIILQMVKFESQSELLDSVRNLIEMHRKIMKDTKNERERKIFDGILD